jgi:hypothetical protein
MECGWRPRLLQVMRAAHDGKKKINIRKMACKYEAKEGSNHDVYYDSTTEA